MKLRILVHLVSVITFAMPGFGSTNLMPPQDSKRAANSFAVSGKNGAIASAHRLASEAGLAMLKDGGNAIDAAIAASFVISVVRPQSTGLGGGGFLVMYNPKDKKTDVYDFREKAPLKATESMYFDALGRPIPPKIPPESPLGKSPSDSASILGHLAVGTPGLVKGLLQIHAEHCRLPLEKVMAPAIKIADEGFAIGSDLESAIKSSLNKLITFPSTKKIFLHKGKPWKEGEILIQKDLAATLREIQMTQGKSFYEGELAKKIVAEIERGQGILSLEDLKSYEVKKREPVLGDYRGYKVISMPPPSSGGTHIVQILNILEYFNLTEIHRKSEADYDNILAEAMRLAYADRATYLGDSDFVKVPLKGITSKPYAGFLKHKINPGHATASDTVQPGNPLPYESPSTTHLSVVDKDGLAVSTTQTINLTFGSGVVAEGTGVVLNNEMDDFSIKAGEANAFGLVGSKANSIQPEKRMLSSMSPTIVLNARGEVVLIAGSPGGSRIITATLQTILNFIDLGLNPIESVHSFRIHQQWKPDVLYYEPFGLNDVTKLALEKMGYKLEVPNWLIGDVQAIFQWKNSWLAVSDTRSEGYPLAH